MKKGWGKSGGERRGDSGKGGSAIYSRVCDLLFFVEKTGVTVGEGWGKGGVKGRGVSGKGGVCHI